MPNLINPELVAIILKAVINPAFNKLVKEATLKNTDPITYEAVLSGDGAIAQGEDAKAIGKDAVLVEGDYKGDVATEDKFSGNQMEVTFQRIAENSQFVIKQLEISYSQAREQAYSWFRFSIIAAGIGLLLMVAGVIVLVLGQTTEGIITTVSSVVPNVISALFFVQSKASNERVDVIQDQLSVSREIHTAVDIANSIETKKERDKLQAEIIRRVISTSNNSGTIQDAATG